jgi:hypothetical protein
VNPLRSYRASASAARCAFVVAQGCMADALVRDGRAMHRHTHVEAPALDTDLLVALHVAIAPGVGQHLARSVYQTPLAGDAGSCWLAYRLPDDFVFGCALMDDIERSRIVGDSRHLDRFAAAGLTPGDLSELIRGLTMLGETTIRTGEDLLVLLAPTAGAAIR